MEAVDKNTWSAVNQAAKNSPREENLWEKKYRAIKKKCREYQLKNDKLFIRAKEIRKLIKRAEAETRYLVKKLEQYEDVDYPKCLPSSKLEVSGLKMDSLTTNRSLMAAAAVRVRGEIELALSQEPDSPPKTIVKPPQPVETESPKPQPPKPGNKRAKSNTPVGTPVPPQLVPIPSPSATIASEKSSLGPPRAKKVKKTPTEKPVKQAKSGGATKRRKADVDPNAPKKPSNAFFWFCQAKRADLQEQFKGEASTGQHDLTKALAKLWSETNLEAKKPYYEQYVMDKARYDQEMTEYTKLKQPATSLEQLANQSSPAIYSVTIPAPEL